MTELYPYQQRGVKWLAKKKGVGILGDQMGLGKSIQVLTWIKRHLPEGPVVIVAPAHLKDNWKNEAKLHTGIRTYIASSRKPPELNTIDYWRKNPKTFVLIINYDILGYWLPFLYDLKPTAVIVDEAQAIKNRKAKRSKAVKKLGMVCKHRIAVTGTPVMNRPAELWSILNFVEPKQYPNFFNFASKHCELTKKPWGWEYKGAKDLDLLNAELKKVMIRRLKRDVLKQLPSVSRHILPVELKDYATYKKAADNFLKWLRSVNWAKASSAAKMEMMAKAGYLKRMAATLKMDSICSWIDNFLEQSPYEKLLVFGIHKKLILRPLHAKYTNSVLVTGDVPSHKRQPLFDQFSKDKKTRICFANMHAAGTGWNGTAASTGLMVELDWVPAIHTQAEARLDRIGQKFPVQWTWMIAKGTIEETECKRLQVKQGVVNAILDGDGDTVDKLAIFNQLMNIYGVKV